MFKNGSVKFALIKCSCFIFFSNDFFNINGFRDFEEIAFGILLKLYETDAQKAELTLMRKIADFDDYTTIQAAVKSETLDVVSHNCFQNVLAHIWYSNISPDMSYAMVSFIINLYFSCKVYSNPVLCISFYSQY